MPEGAQTPKIKLFPIASKSYSLSFFTAKIPLLPRLLLENLDSFATGDLTISVFGDCGEGIFVEPTEIVFKNFTPHGYGFSDDGRAIVEFSFSDVPVSEDLLLSLEKPCEGDLTVRAEFCGAVALREEKIALFPYDYWHGISHTPSIAAAFVTPNHREVERVLKGVVPPRKNSTREERAAAMGEIYRALQGQALIYARASADYAETGQKTNLADSAFSRGSRSMRPIDLALLFCSFAESITLSPLLCFFRGETGASHVFAGIWTDINPARAAVMESMPQLLYALENGDLLLIDPASFTAAHNTDFSQSCKSAYLQATKGDYTLLCAVDIENCRLGGVRPMKLPGTIPEIDFSRYDKVEDAPPEEVLHKELSDAEKELMRSYDNLPLVDFFASGHLRVPLLFADIYELEKKAFLTKKEIVPCPPQIELSSFAPCAENVCSMVLRAADTVFSQAQRTSASEQLAAAKSILSESGALHCAGVGESFEQAREELFYSRDLEIYIAAGFLRTRNAAAETFAPLALYPATLLREADKLFLVGKAGEPTVNRLLLGKLLKLAGISSDDYIEERLPATLKEIFTLFENISAILSKENPKVKREVVREGWLVQFPLRDYHLWTDLLRQRARIRSSPAARALAAKSGELSSAGTRAETYDFFQPLLADSAQKSALHIDGSFILEGPRGSGKTQVCANFLAKEVFYGSCALAVSEHPQRLARLADRLSQIGLSDLCLSMYGDTDGGAALEQIKTALRDLSKRRSYPHSAAKYTLKKTKDEIYAYEYALHKRYPFGFSLYESINAYEQALLSLDKEERESVLPCEIPDFDSLDAGAFESIFTLTNSLAASARNANASCGIQKTLPLCRHPLFGTVPPEGAGAAERIPAHLDAAKRKTHLFEKSAKKILSQVGVLPESISTVPKAAAANRLLQLALWAKDLEIPQELFESDISVFAERICSISTLLSRREKIEKALGFFKREIYEIDVDFCDEGAHYEQKNFLRKFIVRKNVADRLSAYIIPEKRGEFSKKSTGEILRLLSEHKTLTQNLKENGGEIVSDPDRFANVVKISDFAIKADEIFNVLCEFESRDRQEKLHLTLRLAASLKNDEALAERVLLSGVYFNELEEQLQALNREFSLDLSEHQFEGGIFSETGLSARLKSVSDCFCAHDKWKIWLNAKKKASLTGLSPFCEFIERSGPIKNVEKLFYASIFSLAITRLLSADDTCVCAGKAMIAQREYEGLLRQESKKSIDRLLFAYGKELDEYLETDEGKKEKSALESMLVRENASLGAAFRQCAPLLQRLFPVMLADSVSLSKNAGNALTFDAALVLQAQGIAMRRSFGFLSRADRFVFVCDPRQDAPIEGNLIAEVAKLPLAKVTLSNVFADTNGAIYSFANQACFRGALSCFCDIGQISVEYENVGGRFDRAATRVNPAEAKRAAEKAQLLLASGKYETIAIVTFTSPQKEHITRLLRDEAREDQSLRDALLRGNLSVKNAYETQGRCFDAVVLSVACAADDEGRMCVNFGEPSETGGQIGALPATLCDAVCAARKLLSVMTSLSPEDIAGCGESSVGANALCSLLYFCRDRKLAPTLRNYSSKTNADYIIWGLRDELRGRGLNAVVCGDAVNYGMDIEIIPPRGENIAPVALLLDRESVGGICEKLLCERELRLSGYRVLRVRSAVYWREKQAEIDRILNFYSEKSGRRLAVPRS